MSALPEGWSLHFTDRLPGGVDGATRWSDRTVWIAAGLDQDYADFVLAHELQHVRRGPTRGWSQDLEERLCDYLAERAISAAGPVEG